MLRGELPPEMVKSQQALVLDQFVEEKLLKQRAEVVACPLSVEQAQRRAHQGPLRGAFGRGARVLAGARARRGGEQQG